MTLVAPILRALAVVGLAALAGLAALVALSDEPKTYQRESSFAIRPSETVPPEALPDVVGTLAEPDSAVTETIVDILGSARLHESAAEAVGLPPDSVAESGAEYSWTASRRPGSAIVDIRFTGPSDAKLLALQAAAPEEAASLVVGSFGLYRLETLSAPTSPEEVSPKIWQTVVLANLLGALVGVALVLAERKLRSSLGKRTLDSGGDGRRSAPPVGSPSVSPSASTGNNDLSGDSGWLEFPLRVSPGTRASVRRAGPGRIEVAHPEGAPKPKAEEAPKPKTEESPKPKAEASPKPKAEESPKPKAEESPKPKTEARPKRKAARRKR
jgi:hypothetical protein